MYPNKYLVLPFSKDAPLYEFIDKGELTRRGASGQLDQAVVIASVFLPEMLLKPKNVDGPVTDFAQARIFHNIFSAATSVQDLGSSKKKLFANRDMKCLSGKAYIFSPYVLELSEDSPHGVKSSKLWLPGDPKRSAIRFATKHDFDSRGEKIASANVEFCTMYISLNLPNEKSEVKIHYIPVALTSFTNNAIKKGEVILCSHGGQAQFVSRKEGYELFSLKGEVVSPLVQLQFMDTDGTQVATFFDKFAIKKIISTHIMLLSSGKSHLIPSQSKAILQKSFEEPPYYAELPLTYRLTEGTKLTGYQDGRNYLTRRMLPLDLTELLIFIQNEKLPFPLVHKATLSLSSGEMLDNIDDLLREESEVYLLVDDKLINLAPEKIKKHLNSFLTVARIPENQHQPNRVESPRAENDLGSNAKAMGSASSPMKAERPAPSARGSTIAQGLAGSLRSALIPSSARAMPNNGGGEIELQTFPPNPSTKPKRA